MRNPVITLLSDFGTSDHYVASMKGTILKINPRCALVDISHHVSPHDIVEGAFILANTYSSFPKGTIHLAVVDPGVGGPRRPLLFVTAKHHFVGPDNGLFTFALRAERLKRVVALTNERFFLPHISATFHGRDIFAPVAAYLSLGRRPEEFGPRADLWTRLDFEKPKIAGDRLSGEIVHIDVFGNLISNVPQEELFGFSRKRPLEVRVGKTLIGGMKMGYWEGAKGEAIALIGSGGFLEIAVTEGNAARALKAKRGDSVTVQGLSLYHGRDGRATSGTGVPPVNRRKVSDK